MNIRPVIVIPCYNASKTIEETLDSVRKSIIATGNAIPIYVFNDLSQDDSSEVLKRYSEKHNGINIVENEEKLREQGITNLAASMFVDNYDWMFIIHADDIVKEDWLTTLIDEIEKNKSMRLFTVWSSFDTFNPVTGERNAGDDTGAVQKKTRSNEEIKEYIVKVYASWHISGAALSLEAFRIIGGYDLRIIQFADSDLFIKGLLAGFSDIYISRTLTDYRILPTSVSAVSWSTNRDIREIYLFLEKYSHMLNKSEKRRLVTHCISISGKRMLKAFSILSWRKGWENMLELRNSLLQFVKQGNYN